MVRYYYAKECPGADQCSATAWKKCKKYVGHSVEAARNFMIRHLTMSGLHQWDKDRAIAAADEQDWAYHDEPSSDEEPLEEPKDEPESPRRSRSPRRSPCPRPRSPRRTILRDRRSSASSANLLAIAPIGSRAPAPSRDDVERQRQAEFNRVLATIESVGRSLRHAERLNHSAAVAFANEAADLESAIMVLKAI